MAFQKKGNEPPKIDADAIDQYPPSVVPLSDVEMGDALRGMALQARAFTQMDLAVRAFYMSKQNADAIQRRIDAGEDQIKSIAQRIDEAKAAELEKMRGMEQARRDHQADENLKFQASKKDLDSELLALTEQLKGKNDDLNSLADKLEKKHAEISEAIEAENLRLEQHKTFIDDEIIKLESKRLASQEETDRIVAGLAELRSRLHGATQPFAGDVVTGKATDPLDKAGLIADKIS